MFCPRQSSQLRTASPSLKVEKHLTHEWRDHYRGAEVRPYGRKPNNGAEVPRTRTHPVADQAGPSCRSSELLVAAVLQQM